MKALLKKAAGSPAKKPSGSSMGALADLMKAEKSSERRVDQVHERVRAAVDHALAAVLQNAGRDEGKVRDAFEKLSQLAMQATEDLVTAQEDAHREKASSQSALFEARLETMRKAAQVALKNRERELVQKHKRQMDGHSAAVEARMLEGADALTHELSERVERLTEQLSKRTRLHEACVVERDAAASAMADLQADHQESTATHGARVAELEAALAKATSALASATPATDSDEGERHARVACAALAEELALLEAAAEQESARHAAAMRAVEGKLAAATAELSAPPDAGAGGADELASARASIAALEAQIQTERAAHEAAALAASEALESARASLGARVAELAAEADAWREEAARLSAQLAHSSPEQAVEEAAAREAALRAAEGDLRRQLEAAEAELTSAREAASFSHAAREAAEHAAAHAVEHAAEAHAAEVARLREEAARERADAEERYGQLSARLAALEAESGSHAASLEAARAEAEAARSLASLASEDRGAAKAAQRAKEALAKAQAQADADAAAAARELETAREEAVGLRKALEAALEKAHEDRSGELEERAHAVRDALAQATEQRATITATALHALRQLGQHLSYSLGAMRDERDDGTLRVRSLTHCHSVPCLAPLPSIADPAPAPPRQPVWQSSSSCPPMRPPPSAKRVSAPSRRLESPSRLEAAAARRVSAPSRLDSAAARRGAGLLDDELAEHARSFAETATLCAMRKAQRSSGLPADALPGGCPLVEDVDVAETPSTRAVLRAGGSDHPRKLRPPGHALRADEAHGNQERDVSTDARAWMNDRADVTRLGGCWRLPPL